MLLILQLVLLVLQLLLKDVDVDEDDNNDAEGGGVGGYNGAEYIGINGGNGCFAWTLFGDALAGEPIRFGIIVNPFG